MNNIEIFQIDERGYCGDVPFVLPHEPGERAMGLAEPGWYWWSCSPGCLPDGDPFGPFASWQEAFDDSIADHSPKRWDVTLIFTAEIEAYSKDEAEAKAKAMYEWQNGHPFGYYAVHGDFSLNDMYAADEPIEDA